MRFIFIFEWKYIGYPFNTNVMKNKKSFRILILFCISVLIIACIKDEEVSEKFDYSEKIIGKWQQTKSYDLVDGSVTPTSWDWFEVENV